jgi:hypothetical protein
MKPFQGIVLACALLVGVGTVGQARAEEVVVGPGCPPPPCPPKRHPICRFVRKVICAPVVIIRGTVNLVKPHCRRCPPPGSVVVPAPPPAPLPPPPPPTRDACLPPPRPPVERIPPAPPGSGPPAADNGGPPPGTPTRGLAPRSVRPLAPVPARPLTPPLPPPPVRVERIVSAPKKHTPGSRKVTRRAVWRKAGSKTGSGEPDRR